MKRPLVLAGLLLAASVAAGCGSTAGALLSANSSPPAHANEEPMARSMYAGWIAARAKRCGFNRDPDAIKSRYLAFEAKQGATSEQLANFEKSYRATFASTYEKLGADPDFCTNKIVGEVKLALQHQDAGDYAANFPTPEPNSCGYFGCPYPVPPAKPFDPKTYWENRAKDPLYGGR